MKVLDCLVSFLPTTSLPKLGLIKLKVTAVADFRQARTICLSFVN